MVEWGGPSFHTPDRGSSDPRFCADCSPPMRSTPPGSPFCAVGWCTMSLTRCAPRLCPWRRDGLPIGFLVVDLHFGKDLGRCAAPRPQTGLPAACWGRPRTLSRTVPNRPSSRVSFECLVPPRRQVGRSVPLTPWASKLCDVCGRASARSQVQQRSSIRRRSRPGGPLQCPH